MNSGARLSVFETNAGATFLSCSDTSVQYQRQLVHLKSVVSGQNPTGKSTTENLLSNPTVNLFFFFFCNRRGNPWYHSSVESNLLSIIVVRTVCLDKENSLV